MPTWILLVGAIVAEVTGTVSLRASEGLSRVGPTVLVAVGYLAAFVLLSRVLEQGMGLGVAYGVWAAAGVTLVAILGAVLFGDTLTPVQVGGVALVVGGVLALELGGQH